MRRHNTQHCVRREGTNSTYCGRMIRKADRKRAHTGVNECKRCSSGFNNVFMGRGQ